MNIREGVFDRIEDTVVLFKNNFVNLFLPMFLYNFLSIVVLGTFIQYYFMNKLSTLDNLEDFDIFTFLNDPVVSTIIVVSVFLFILYLMLYIVIFLGLLKTIKQINEGVNVDIIENFKYGISRFYLSMKTYWYIFSYIALIPSLLFIVGGILFNISYYVGGLGYLETIGGGLMIIGLLMFIIFSIYRGTKATFGLYSAVDGELFDKNNFLESVKFTENNWWRIIGNFLLLGLLVSLVGGLIGGIFSLISFGMSGGTSMVDGLITAAATQDPELIKEAFDNYLLDFSIINEIFGNIITNIINTISAVFIITFTYIFYLRLKIEGNSLKKEITDNDIINEKIEL